MNKRLLLIALLLLHPTVAAAHYVRIVDFDTTATGAELETLTDGSDSDALHIHPAINTEIDSDIATHKALASDHHTATTARTDEEIEDLYGAAVSGNTETRIAVTYDDADGTLDFVVDDMNDDVPESGDFGNAADLESTGALSDNTVGLDELNPCPTGTKIVEHVSGTPTCKDSTPVTLSGGETDGDMLLYDTNVFKDVPMSGDATMTKAGLVTVHPRSAAICTTQTGGVTDELCVDSTSGAGTGIWRCPSPGDCNGTTAWERVDDTTGGGGGVVGFTFEECFPVYAPSAEIADTDDIQSVWRASAALTITEVWCETDTGTVTMDLQIDDDTPADVMGTDLVCAATAVSDSISLTGGMAAGDRLDFLIASVATNPTRLTVCIEYDYD